MHSSYGLSKSITNRKTTSINKFNKLICLQDSRPIFNDNGQLKITPLVNNVVDAFKLSFGDVFILQPDLSFSSQGCSDQLIVTCISSEQYSVWEVFQTALISNKPIVLLEEFSKSLFNINPNKSNKSKKQDFIIFPINFLDKPIGILLLGGYRERNTHNFISMGRSEIFNLVTIAARGLYREIYQANNLDPSRRTLNELLVDIYGHDAYTGAHSNKVAFILEKIAASFGCSSDTIQIIKWSAFLHDIGKMFIPSRILNKPGKLDEADWVLVKKHPEIGSQIVMLTTGLEMVAEIVMTHHEKYDGSGYPLGIARAEIPLAARILSVVDAFGAMTERRIYQKPVSYEAAIRELWRCAGIQFDPMVVKVFADVMDEVQLGDSA
jgi:putative nucleotidyltransferase with HDIG domain